MFLAVLSAAFTKEILDDNASRVVLKIPAPLAPVKVAILPLVKKDGLPELANDLANKLKFDYNFQIDIKDSIGKRYRRQDAIGTPICVTIDHQTKDDNTATIRFRDSMKQERVSLDEIEHILNQQLGWKNLLTNLA